MIVETKILRPKKYFAWIITAVMLIYAFIIFTEDHLPSWKDILILIIGVGIAAWMLLLNRTALILDNQGITYKGLRKDDFIPYSKIEFADLVTHYHGHGYSVKWEITTTEGSYTLDPNGKKNMRLMAEALFMKLPSTALGQRVLKLAEGKRVWFF